MSARRWANKPSFKIKTTAGKEYTVIVRVEILDGSTRDDPDGEAEGQMALTTKEGNHSVNWISKGKYEVLTPAGKIGATSDDPNAIGEPEP